MEEKEKYELFGKHCIKDNSPDARPQLFDAYVACVILNEQDKRIKELKEENKFLKKRNEKLIIDRRDLCLERNDIFEENQQLKQAQKQLAINELEKLKDFIDHNIKIENDMGALKLEDFYSNQIKSLKGGE